MPIIPRKVSWLCFIFLAALNGYAQTIVQLPAKPDLITIPPYLRGHNVTHNALLSWIHDSIVKAEFPGICPGIVRWPGGTSANYYDGVKSIGTAPSRAEFPEIVAFADTYGLAINYMINFGNCSAHGAAEKVRLCNSNRPKYQNLRNALFGSPQPLNIRKWEIGNEITNPWSFGVAWIAWNPVIYKRNGTFDSLPQFVADSLYYSGGSFRRYGWVPENGELSKLDAILGEVYIPKPGDGDTLDIAVSFPSIGPGPVDVWVVVSTTPASALDSLPQQQIYDYLTLPRFKLPPSQYQVLNDTVVRVYSPAKVPDSVTAILIEYETTGHPGAFEIRDSMKAADPTIEVGYEVDFIRNLLGNSWFDNRLKQSPPDFMIQHFYNNTTIVQLYNNNAMTEILYLGGSKTENLQRLQSNLRVIADTLGIAPPGIGLTEWNILLCDACPTGFNGILGAMYVGRLWHDFFRAFADSSIDFRLINHFALVASGNNHLHLFHAPQTTIPVTAGAIATRMVAQTIGKRLFIIDSSRIDHMEKTSIIYKLNSGVIDTFAIDAFLVTGGADSLETSYNLMVFNISDTASKTITFKIPPAWQADSVHIELRSGNPSSTYSTLLDTNFTLTQDSLTLTMPPFSLAGIWIQVNNCIDSPVKTWTGKYSTDWHNPCNWDCGVPTINDDVIIPGGTLYNPAIDDTAYCKTLQIDVANGGNLMVNTQNGGVLIKQP